MTCHWMKIRWKVTDPPCVRASCERFSDVQSALNLAAAQLRHPIMTSERAHIKDSRVRKLADGIIEAQVREIKEMKQLIAELEAKPVPETARDIPPAIKSVNSARGNNQDLWTGRARKLQMLTSALKKP